MGAAAREGACGTWRRRGWAVVSGAGEGQGGGGGGDVRRIDGIAGGGRARWRLLTEVRVKTVQGDYAGEETPGVKAFSVKENGTVKNGKRQWEGISDLGKKMKSSHKL